VTHIHPVGWEQAFARLRRLGYLCEKHGNRLHRSEQLPAQTEHTKRPGQRT